MPVVMAVRVVLSDSSVTMNFVPDNRFMVQVMRTICIVCYLKLRTL